MPSWQTKEYTNPPRGACWTLRGCGAGDLLLSLETKPPGGWYVYIHHRSTEPSEGSSKSISFFRASDSKALSPSTQHLGLHQGWLVSVSASLPQLSLSLLMLCMTYSCCFTPCLLSQSPQPFQKENLLFF